MSAFNYNRLGPRQVRLVYLQADHQAATPLHVRLMTVDFDDAPPFVALSYVWGGYDTPATIICDETPRRVTSSLAEALRLIRASRICADAANESQHKPIWIDAICINQDDSHERAEQVTLMGEVFAKAHAVLMSLGGDEEMHKSAAILIDIIYNACLDFASREGVSIEDVTRRSEHEGLSRVPLDTIQHAADRLHMPPGAWDCLRRLFSQPYFRRTWCVQEVTLAQNARIISPNIPFSTLGVVAMWFASHNRARYFSLPESTMGLEYTECCYMFEGVNEGDDLIAILDKFRLFNATDPRDKVYGLLGLLRKTNSKLNLQVDYAGKSLADVFVDVAWADIQQTQTLRVLSYVGRGRVLDDSLKDGVPSWVPRWDKPPLTCLIDAEGDTWRACGPMREAKLVGQLASESLSAVGVVFDTVDTAFELKARYHEHGLDSDYASLMDHLWRGLESRDVTSSAVANLAMTLTAGQDYAYNVVQDLEVEDRNQFLSDFLAWMKTLLPSQGIFDCNAHPHELGSTSTGNADHYRIALSRVCEGRQVFRVKRGPLGLGPACMEKGDVIVMLYGGSVPYALRPVGEEWLFLGECWVESIMNGELCGASPDGQGQEEVTFRIV